MSRSPRPRARRAALLAAAVAGAVLLTGCAADTAGEPVGGGNDQGYVAGDGTITVVPRADRVPAPELSGPTLDGATWSLADQQGQTVVLNVWASWCPPCRAEMPGLQRLSQRYAAQGVAFAGLDTRDTDAAARAFVENIGVTYPQVVDPDGRLLLAFRDSLPPQAIPSTLIVDDEGLIAARVIGPITEPRLAALLDDVLAS
jgi:thiol-disulfide isomerase/thioredoxin